ncbi:uncharacterized protein LOC120286067 [Eucalyptus grandis]|uniref:uncharacterized protein LOC120286067 n=1 Tax=Eucalyptus grandis TaxID=71139 RepID=UPI00192E89AA|nr:uncharacterized protein LOC120286067 [Eucalyptus grandis]
MAEAREALRSTQVGLQDDPANSSLADLEKFQCRAFVELRLQEESFYCQKSRVKWLKEGDRNTKFFHHSMKNRQLNNHILSVKDPSDSIITDPFLVPQVFVSYFSKLLSPQVGLSKSSLQELKTFIYRPLSDAQCCSIACPVTNVEIKETLFSLTRGKAPGPDGFSVEFFKTNWGTVGSLVLEVVKDFFSSGYLLKERKASTYKKAEQQERAAKTGAAENRWQASGVIRGSGVQSGRQAGSCRGHARLPAEHKTGGGKKKRKRRTESRKQRGSLSERSDYRESLERERCWRESVETKEGSTVHRIPLPDTFLLERTEKEGPRGRGRPRRRLAVAGGPFFSRRPLQPFPLTSDLRSESRPFQDSKLASRFQEPLRNARNQLKPLIQALHKHESQKKCPGAFTPEQGKARGFNHYPVEEELSVAVNG